MPFPKVHGGDEGFGMTRPSLKVVSILTIVLAALASLTFATAASSSDASSPSSSSPTSSSSSSSSSIPRRPISGIFPSFGLPSRSRTLLEDVLSAPLTSNPGSSSEGICRPTGQIHDACCDYETVEKRLNTPQFFQTLKDLVQTNYFRYYKVDLYKDCPFWNENGLCMNRACVVEKASEEEIPEEYRSSRLSSVDTADRSEVIFPKENDAEFSQISNSSPDIPSDSCVCRETDFCHWEAEEFSPEATWVDLIKNPERFTGYAGPGANRVWKAIYEENCFGAVPKGSFIEPPRAKSSGGGTGFAGIGRFTGGSSSNVAFGIAPPDLSNLVPSLEAPADPAANEQCLEKRVFYRVISGLHASISTHICAEYLDQKTGEWSPNLECFVSRIAQHPERLQNVYFNYVLLVRALARAGDYLTSFRLKKGHAIPVSEQRTLTLLESLVSQANQCPPTFDEASMFQTSNPEASLLKQQFRSSFRNISAIMDCVGCDKCRLWGKMQVNGLGAAMKILFSFDEEDLVDVEKNPAPLLERSELVALINTLHRFAESLKAVETFRQLYQDQLKEVADQASQEDQEGQSGADIDNMKSGTDAVMPTMESSPPHPNFSPSTRQENSANHSHRSSKQYDGKLEWRGEELSSTISSRVKRWSQLLVASTTHLFDVCKVSLSRCVDWSLNIDGSVRRTGRQIFQRSTGGEEDQEGSVAKSEL